MVEDLAQKFYSMSENEQRAFVIRVMPAIYRLFRDDPRTMMEEIMPICREMMVGCGMDMNEMMKMMGKFEKR